MIDFLICYEHHNREIENDALLKHELEKRGYSCKIIKYDGPGIYLYSKMWNRAKVVVTPWLRYNENVYHFLKLSAKPHKLVNLQWEQVYAQAGINNGLVSTTGESLKGYHLCWGNHSRQRLIKAGVKPENAIVVGAIQMDYGFPQFAEYFKTKEFMAEKFHLDLNKHWVLYISSFGFANYNKEDLTVLNARFGSYICDLADMHETSQRDMLRWIEHLLGEYECEFIYRPHPSERNLCFDLERLEREYPKFHVISEYSVKQWACVCEKVNLWLSTSNAELLSMGVDYGIIRPKPVPADFEVESMKDEILICSYEEFKRFNINTVSDNHRLTEERKDRLIEFYDYDATMPAYKKTADALIHILEQGEGQDYRFSLKERVKFERKEIKQLFISYLLETQMKFAKRDILNLIPVPERIRGNMRQTVRNACQTNRTIACVLNYMDENDRD